MERVTYLLPGASSGIGLCAARKLAQTGANVVILARNAEKLEAAVAALPGEGLHEGIVFDVANIVSIDDLVRSLREKYGKIDGMIYCVGNGDIARLRDLSFERLHAVMLDNFYAFIQFTRSLSSQKPKKEPLAIVAISSLASSSPEKYFTAYSASKAALEASIGCLALELCGRNARINAVKPGVVRTERLDYLNETTGDIEAKIKEKGFQPMGLIPPEDVADLAIYLLSPQGAFINGASLPVNGGASC